MITMNNFIWAIIPFFALFSPNVLAGPLIILGISALFSKHKFRSYNTPSIIFLVFIIYSGVTSLFSISPEINIVELLRLSAMALIYFLILSKIESYSTDERLKHNTIFKYAFSISTLFLAIAFFTGCLSVFPFVTPNTNFFNKGACTISVISWLLMFSYISSSTKGKLKSFICYIATTSLVFTMESESAMLASVVATLVFLISKLHHKMYKIFAILTPLCFLAAPVIIYVYVTYYTDFTPFELQSSWEHRIYIAFNTISLILENPILGWGFNASKFIAMAQNGNVIIGENILPMLNFHPHNSSLQILLDTGIIGLIIFVICLSTLITHIGKSEIIDNKLKPYIYAGLSSYIIIGQLNFNVWATWWVGILMIFGLMSNSLSNIASKDTGLNTKQ